MEQKKTYEDVYDAEREMMDSVDEKFNGFDNRKMHDKCLEAMKKNVEHLATITDVEYDEAFDEFDVEFQDGCYTVHLGWGGCTVDADITLDEADLDAIHHLIEHFGHGEFNEFFPETEVA